MRKLFFVSIQLVQVKLYPSNYLWNCKEMENRFEKYDNKNAFNALRK